MFNATRAPQHETSGWLSRRFAAVDERWPGGRRRVIGMALALLIEAALFLAILSLGQADSARNRAGESLTTVDFAPEPAPEPDTAPPPEPAKVAQPTALPRVVPSPRPDQPTPKVLPFPMPPAAVIPTTRQEAPPASAPSPIKAIVREDAAGPIGPAAPAGSGDSQRVGTRNGEPVYAARWYREPTDDELRGYLSTASGPGWALITCRTAPGYRVEDCELEDEYPAGAQIGRAVMAAAWQFKVRPPQIGGRVLVGEWVRIRITYEMKRR
jgi:protein TonB